jgi:hypothetical protein
MSELAADVGDMGGERQGHRRVARKIINECGVAHDFEFKPHRMSTGTCANRLYDTYHCL